MQNYRWKIRRKKIDYAQCVINVVTPCINISPIYSKEKIKTRKPKTKEEFAPPKTIFAGFFSPHESLHFL